MRLISHLLAAIMGTVLAALAPEASATEYCVSCAGPDAIYRCEIEGTPEGAGTDPKAQILCTTELAKSGGHENCAVSRGSTVPCPGETRLLAAPIPEPGPPPTIGADAPEATAPEPASEDAAPPGEP